MEDSIDVENKANREKIVTWLVENADILPTRAVQYAGLIIDAGIGSMHRVSKKLSKKDSFLVDIGVDEDDAEEIVAALLRETNVGRKEAIQSGPSRRMSLNTKSISYQSPLHSPALSTKSESPLHISSKNPTSSGPSSAGPKLVSAKSATNLADPPSRNIERPKSLSTAEFAALMAEEDGGMSVRQKAKRMLSKVEEGEDDPPTDPSPPPTTTVIPVPVEKAKSSDHVLAEYAKALAGPSSSAPDGAEGGSSKRASIISKITQISRGDSGGGGGQRLSHIALLRPGSETPAVAATKDLTELQDLCASIAGDLQAAAEYRNEDTAAAALSRVYETSAEDMGYFVQRLGELGACKSISTLLATFTHSSDTCLCATKAISTMCQYGESRDSINTLNMENLAEHGTCTSLLRVLSTHEKNAEMVEWTCRAIGKLSNVEKNIAIFTKANTCEKMLTLLQDTHTTVSTCNEAAYVIRSLAQRDATADRLLEIGVSEALVGCLAAHDYDESLSREVIRCLLMLGHSAVGCKRLGEAGSCAAVVESMRRNESSVSLAEWALMCLEMLLNCEENFSRLLQASVCDVLVHCLHHHMQVPNVARGACRAVQLLAANDMIRSKLGSDGACEVFPRVLSNHIGTPSIAQVSCGAIGAVASDHPENKAKLTAAGACEYLVMTIQKYSTTDNFRKGMPAGFETVAWQACWALRKLATGGVNRARMESASACEALHQAAMKHVGSPDVLVQVFRAINVLTSNKTHPIVLHMGNAGACKSVVRAVLKNAPSETVCKLGAEAICHLADCPDNIEKIIASKGFEALSGMLMTHGAASEGISQWACRAMHRLVSTGEHAQAAARKVDCVEAVVWALQRQGKHQEVAEWGIVALKEMAANAANRPRIGAAGGCEVVITIAKRHSHIPAITHRSCSIIHFLSQEANNRAWLGASGGCDVVVRAFLEHGNIPIVCAAASLAVASLAHHHEGNNNRLRSSGACAQVMEAMQRHLSSTHVCDNGCQATYRLGEFAEAVRMLQEADACGVVLAAMKTHSTDHGVALHALRSLVVLSSPQYPELYPMLVAKDVHDILITTLKDNFTAEVDISIEACRVITNLATRPDSRIELGLDGACGIVATILKQHESSSPEVVLEGTVASSQLATSCSENVQLLTDSGVCESLVASLDHYRSNDDIAEAICRCLVLLTSCSSATAVLSSPEKCQLLVRNLSKMKGTSSSVLWMFRLILSVCHDQSSCGRFGAAGAHKVITSTILQYKDCQGAVRYGIDALLRLSTVNDTTCDENLCKLYTHDTYETLSVALKLYSHDIDLADSALRLIALMTTSGDAGAEKVGEVVSAEGAEEPVTAALAKPSRWSLFKKTILREKTESLQVTSGQAQALSTEERAARLAVRAKLGDAGVCEGIMRAMLAHSDVECTSLSGCIALRNLCSEANNVELIGRAGGCEVISAVFKMYASRSEALVMDASSIITALVKHKASRAAIFVGLGTSEILTMSMLYYSSSPCTVISVCQAAVALATSHPPARATFGAADACRALLNIMEEHHLNPDVCAEAAKALHAMMDGNVDNIARVAFLSPLRILVDALTAGRTVVVVVQHILWIMTALCPREVVVDGNRCLFSSLLVNDVRGLIMSCFLSLAAMWGEVCEEGCELLSALMEAAPHQRTFLVDSGDTDACVQFGGAGVCDIVANALNAFLSQESVLAACLRVLSLLSRVVNTHYVHDRDRHSAKITESHTNVQALVSFKTQDTIIKILHKYPSNHDIIRYGILTLSNMLPSQPPVQESASSALKSLFKSMCAAQSDAIVARYGCVFIYQLAECGRVYHDKLVVSGAGLFVGDALRMHLTSPPTVRDACVAVGVLAKMSDLAKERLAAAGACNSLSQVIAAYSLNREVAVEACIAVAVMMNGSPAVCARFASTEIDSNLLGLLQSFGFGEGECASIFAENTCKALGDFASPDEQSDTHKAVTLSKKGIALNHHNPAAHLSRANRMGTLGICETLVLALEKYRADEAVIATACYAISRLCVTPENISRLKTAGASEAIRKVREAFPDSTITSYAQVIMDIIGGST